MQIRGTLRPTMAIKNLAENKNVEIEQASDEGKKDEPGYIDRLTRLFPVEGVTLYPLAIGIAGTSKSLLIGLIVFIGCFIGVLRYFATQPFSGGRPKILAVAVSIIAFLLYAFTLGGFGYVFGDVERHTLLSSFVTIIFTGSLGAMKFGEETD